VSDEHVGALSDYVRAAQSEAREEGRRACVGAAKRMLDAAVAVGDQVAEHEWRVHVEDLESLDLDATALTFENLRERAASLRKGGGE
jgi:hypothetical protein